MWALAASLSEKYKGFDDLFYERSRRYIETSEMKVCFECSSCYCNVNFLGGWVRDDISCPNMVSDCNVRSEEDAFLTVMDECRQVSTFSANARFV